MPMAAKHNNTEIERRLDMDMKPDTETVMINANNKNKETKRHGLRQGRGHTDSDVNGFERTKTVWTKRERNGQRNGSKDKTRT